MRLFFFFAFTKYHFLTYIHLQILNKSRTIFFSDIGYSKNVILLQFIQYIGYWKYCGVFVDYL